MSEGCHGCNRALELAQWVRKVKSQVDVQVIDLTCRVAILLLRLADENSDIIEGYSHDDLAAMVGCQRESFTVVLDRFRGSNASCVGFFLR